MIPEYQYWAKEHKWQQVKEKKLKYEVLLCFFVPPMFRLSQREANSATLSSFTIWAKYYLEKSRLN